MDQSAPKARASHQPRTRHSGSGRFPIDRFRSIRFGRGLICPRCSGTRVHRWGRFGWRQRYRCLGCRRTFSDFTGSPLFYLKHVDRWPAFCRLTLQTHTVRGAAETLRLHKDTVFRWRHRLLSELERTDRTILTDRVCVGDTWLPWSEKGSRSVRRDSHRARFFRSSRDGRVAWLVLAGDTSGASFGAFAGDRRPAVRQYESLLGGRLGRTVTVASVSGKAGAPALFARRCGLRWAQCAVSPFAPGQTQEHPAAHAVRLKRWLRIFRGVATKYLDRYFAWFRLLDAITLGKVGQTERAALLAGRFP